MSMRVHIELGSSGGEQPPGGRGLAGEIMLFRNPVIIASVIICGFLLFVMLLSVREAEAGVDIHQQKMLKAFQDIAIAEKKQADVLKKIERNMRKECTCKKPVVPMGLDPSQGEQHGD